MFSMRFTRTLDPDRTQCTTSVVGDSSVSWRDEWKRCNTPSECQYDYNSDNGRPQRPFGSLEHELVILNS